MTLTQFMARSTWIAYAFEWGKLLKCHLKGKTSRKMVNGQNINYSEKRQVAQGQRLLTWKSTSTVTGVCFFFVDFVVVVVVVVF